ncbi:MAG: glycosyltransferase family 2 protein [Spirochaetia bacterium]|nr:glycosyltransferase family 2 protein [Spirochaetia bacterium]
MKTNTFDTPIAYIIFNRPEETERSFAVLQELRPSRLFIIADGARNKPGEAEQCAQTRAIMDRIDWPCEIKRNFSDQNLGCKNRIASGITWVFEQVEEAIILEDDCIPDLSFFYFCRELLDRYKSDSRVMSIAGVNFQFGNTAIPDSYYFSKFNHIWGWATWRRAWQKYDVTMRDWPSFKVSNTLKEIVQTSKTRGFFNYVFDSLHANKIDTWDGQWTFAHLANRGLCIIPGVNLVSNIGFGMEATHTKNKLSRYANMATLQLRMPLQHPVNVSSYPPADLYTERTLYAPRIPPRIKEFIFKWIGR